jgi:hypothetical protein
LPDLDVHSGSRLRRIVAPQRCKNGGLLYVCLSHGSPAALARGGSLDECSPRSSHASLTLGSYAMRSDVGNPLLRLAAQAAPITLPSSWQGDLGRPSSDQRATECWRSPLRMPYRRNVVRRQLWLSSLAHVRPLLLRARPMTPALAVLVAACRAGAARLSSCQVGRQL